MSLHRNPFDSPAALSLSVVAIASALVAMSVWANPAAAQDSGGSAPVAIESAPGVVIDGTLDDWSAIPVILTEGGPQPSADPATNGGLSWQTAADSSTVFFAATITDDTIVAGEHGENYWNEDSIEFYLNLSGDLAATAYGPGVVQVRVSPIDIGNNDPNALTVTGNGIEQVGVQGFVFATEAGWGTEISINISGLSQPTVGEPFGLQVHANGSSAGDRDLKLIWSAADLDDTSFQDPSVFGQAVFTGSEGVAVGEGADGEAAVETEPAAEGVGVEPIDQPDAAVDEVDSIVDDGPAVVTGEEQQRSLFYAAIASSIAVLGGGLLFERKRKKDEERLGRGERDIAPVDDETEVEAADETRTDDASEGDASEVTEVETEFEALMDSILDDPPS